MGRVRWSAAGALALVATPVSAAPDEAVARRVFAEAEAICARDRGAMWGTSLCGPMLIVDHTDRAVIANVADGEGRLTRDGDVYRGTLTGDVVIADTPTTWSGTRWTQLVAQLLPADAAQLRVRIAHELFHRIQASLTLNRPSEGGNRHLDTLEGRYLLQLEWRALARALQGDAAGREDAVAFRRERYRRFPRARAEENALEVNEGIPEYTGVRLGLDTPQARVAYASYDLQAFVGAPTFVRSFAYATGPAYGLLLDRVDRDWVRKLAAGQSFDALLQPASGPPLPLARRIARYDDGTLRRSEERRDAERQTRLAEYRRRLIDGPVLLLPLGKANFQFNPQTLTPLEGVGMIYPTGQISDAWGTLVVERGGVLARDAPRQASVAVSGAEATRGIGEGWRLTLKPGWTIVPGARTGDLQVRCTGACP